MKDISQLVPDAAAFDREVVVGLRVAVDTTVKKTKLRARLQKSWKDRTYATRDSIDGDSASTSAGAVGAVHAGANAVRLNDGTPPHEIRARRKKFLRFQQGGATRFAKAVQHPGTKPDPFLDAAADAAGEVLFSAVEAALDAALG